jgi:WD40 repeat protein
VIAAVAFSPDGRRALSGGMDKGLWLWDAGSGQLLTTWSCAGRVTALVFSPDGRRVLSASRDRALILWDAENGRQLNDVPVVGSFPTSLAIQGDCVLVGNYDSTLTLYRPAGLAQERVRP